MGASTTPTLNNPLQLSLNSFTLSQSNAFTASGNNLTSSNIVAVNLTSTVVNWSNISFSVKDATTLSLTGTPTAGGVAPTGNLTVTINPGPKQSSASCNGLIYT